jgi:two-component sensor histidine kinase
LNEVVSNSLKHAFPATRSGTIAVSLHREGARGALLELRDDGIGLDRFEAWRHSPTLGLKLVRMFEQQLGARVEVSRKGGTCFRMSFPRLREESANSAPTPSADPNEGPRDEGWSDDGR